MKRENKLTKENKQQQQKKKKKKEKKKKKKSNCTVNGYQWYANSGDALLLRNENVCYL